MENKICCL